MMLSGLVLAGANQRGATGGVRPPDDATEPVPADARMTHSPGRNSSDSLGLKKVPYSV